MIQSIASPADNPVRSIEQDTWDRYDAYIFDIDGTLLHCADAVHYFAFCETLSLIAGRPLNLDGVVAHGNTDTGILRDALRIAGVSENHWRPRLAEMCSMMCRLVEERKADFKITVLPAVTSVLAYLHRQRKVVGIASGNLEAIGRLKLARCGLLDSFEFFAFSDLCESREQVFQVALEKIHSIAGNLQSVCVFGDTPYDVKAARTHRLNAIAVATGIYSFEQLLCENPDQCLYSLNDLPLNRL